MTTFAVIRLVLGVALLLLVINYLITVVRDTAKRQLPARFIGFSWLTGVGFLGTALARIVASEPQSSWIAGGFSVVSLTGLVLTIRTIKQHNRDKAESKEATPGS